MRFEDKHENKFSWADMSYCLFVYATRDYEGITCRYGVHDMHEFLLLAVVLDRYPNLLAVLYFVPKLQVM